jgi:hypothetical protein
LIGAAAEAGQVAIGADHAVKAARRSAAVAAVRGRPARRGRLAIPAANAA